MTHIRDASVSQNAAHHQQPPDVVRIARSRVGKPFRAGKPEQCALFVRDVFQEAGIRLPVAARPTDMQLLPAGAGLGEAYANSLAGDEVGAKVNIQQIRPGDIVLYRNTYGAYRPGVITHVAIYVGNNTIVHRPTMDKPVAAENLHYAVIAEVRRPKALKTGHSAVKLFHHDNRTGAFRDGKPAHGLEIRISYHAKLRVWINGQEADPKSLEFQMFI